jgi:hypothetical protein
VTRPTDFGQGCRHDPKGNPGQPRRFHELMAGSRGLSHAVCRAGCPATSWEIQDSPFEDVLHHKNRAHLKNQMDHGLIRALWYGLVCATWSSARRNRKSPYTGRGWPPPLRDRGSSLWGLPHLSDADRRRVQDANRQARWAFAEFAHAAQCGIPCVIENPVTSMLWLTAPALRLLKKYLYIDIDMCAFGAHWKKPTRLLYANCDLSSLGARRCHLQGGLCSFSGAPHLVLTGCSGPKGGFNTNLANCYPKKLCGEAAKLVCR